jgi:RNA methyltransferase, TrmH family
MLGKSRLKYIQSLGHKKQREEEGLFIAEGPKMAAEVLAGMTSLVEEVFGVQEWMGRFPEKYPAVRFTEVSEEELSRMSHLSTPNQVLVLLRIPEPVTEINPAGKLTLLLDTIQDPGNLGTIIRIADWFGITQIVCSETTADLYSPKVVQSTMGSIVRVSLMYTQLQPWLLSATAVPAYAAALEGIGIREIGRLDEGIIIIGNESKGIDPAIMQLVQNRITIPRLGGAESLNAAVAAGIILSHLT